MQASDEMVKWIDEFVEKKITKMPSNDKYDFRIFESAKEMHEVIAKKNKEYSLSRVVATFDYEHKKDGNHYFIEEGELKIPWNSTSNKLTWAENASTVNEAGSIYTIQGFDLNYVGVILGPSLSYDENIDSLRIVTKNYSDTEAYRGKDGINDLEKAKEQIILNSINVLMKRGIHGLYIYASDPKLRKKLLELQK